MFDFAFDSVEGCSDGSLFNLFSEWYKAFFCDENDFATDLGDDC